MQLKHRPMQMKFTPTGKIAVLLFLGLFASYLSLSPGTIAGQGYAGEEMDSGLRMLSVATAWMKGHQAPPMLWSRHGPVPVLFDLPFLKLGKLAVSPDFALSFEPVLFTAGLATILFLWLRKVCSPGMSLFLTLTAAFGTMLWPYAYIGLETKQSFFVLLAGYLALAGGKIRSWPRVLFFAIVCALAMTIKSTGVTLLPAIAYLVYVQFRDDWRIRRSQMLVLVLIVVGVSALGVWGRNFYWTPMGGGADALRPWLVDSPFQVFSNAIGVFGSPTKGLLVYSPLLIAGLYAVPRAFRGHHDIVIYTSLVTACTLGLLSVLVTASDEVWGCRYLHLAIPLLILCIGAAWPRFRWRREAWLAVLGIVGVAISFLGAFFYYGVRDFAMKDAGQNTMEWIAGDNVWNHIEFNDRLLHTWLEGGTLPALWTPRHVWVWTPPPDASPWKSINLRNYCEPQSFLVRFWHVPKTGLVMRLFVMYLLSLIAGVSLLAGVFLGTVKEQRTESAADFALDAHELRVT